MEKGLVLVIEDDEDNRHLVVFLLKTGGLEVIEAGDGREGLAKAQLHHPALILLDMSIPEINGWDLARMLKANPDTQNILVVALTGHTQMGDRQKALDAGCDSYISKPLDTLTFIEQVTELLNRPS